MLRFSVLLSTTIQRLKSEEGAGLAEYALLLALIAVVCVTALTTLGTNISTTISGIAGSL